KQNSFGSDLSASKITDAYKIDLSFFLNRSNASYQYLENESNIKLKTQDEYTNIQHSYVKSLSAKWSFGYEVVYKHSTYNNFQHVFLLSNGLEYNIYPYKQSGSKFLVIRYRINTESRVYIEKTLLDKKKEWLFSNDLG